MKHGEQDPKNSSATTFALLTVATFVALAPLCSVAASLPGGSIATAGPANHALRTSHHDTLMIGSLVTTSRDDSSNDRCAEYSCCATAELANSATSRRNTATSAPAVVAAPAAVPRRAGATANSAGPTAPSHATARLVPLRL